MLASHQSNILNSTVNSNVFWDPSSGQVRGDANINLTFLLPVCVTAIYKGLSQSELQDYCGEKLFHFPRVSSRNQPLIEEPEEWV